MKFHSYESIDVALIRHTPNQKELVGLAANLTMHKETNKEISASTIKALLDMGHSSIFEHLSYTFLIKGSSRSYLSQVTRHRIASYTSGSQHYQNYQDYNSLMSQTLTKSQIKIYKDSIKNSMMAYKKLVLANLPHSEARQVLPNAMENNLLITINARSLINFFNQRLCNRNTEEIQIIAEKQLALVYPLFPELWEHVGPDCYQKSKCSQQKMSCGNKWIPRR